jgi:hypothetical protein
MLEDAISLATLAPRSIARQRLIELSQSAHADGNVYVCRTTTAGNANLSLFQALPLGDGACAPVVRYLGRDAPHSWRDEYVVLYNFPCYLATRCGALITQDAKIVAESLYPSAGELSFAHFIGVELPQGGIADLIAGAGRIATEGPCSAFFSRWSSVYFHAMSETLAQTQIYRGVGLAPRLTWIAPPSLAPVQKKLVAYLRAKLVFSAHEIVAVPRAIYRTVGCRHAALGLDFRLAIENRRLAAREAADALAHYPGTAAPLCLARRQRVAPVDERGGGGRDLRTTRICGRASVDDVTAGTGATVLVGPCRRRPARRRSGQCRLRRTRGTAVRAAGAEPQGRSGRHQRKLSQTGSDRGSALRLLRRENELDADRWTMPEEESTALAKLLVGA